MVPIPIARRRLAGDTVRVQVVERVGGERRRQGCRSDSQGQRSAAAAAAKRAGDGGSGRSHAIDEEARHAGSDQPFVTLMSQLLTQRAFLSVGHRSSRLGFILI